MMMVNSETGTENANSMDDIAAGRPIVVGAPSHTPTFTDESINPDTIMALSVNNSTRQQEESPDSGKALILDNDIDGYNEVANNPPITATTLEMQPTKLQMQSIPEEPPKGKMGDEDTPGLANFKVLYIVTQLLGLTMIILMGAWIGVHMGGLAGTSDPRKEFNWHPLLMTIGLIYLYGNSILIYRAFRSMRKKQLKIVHAGIHMGAFILTVIALKTVFDSHNLAQPNPIPNMYSLHSWLGLGAVIIFCLQYVAGFVAYLAPGLREHYRIALMPLHIYFGIFGFGLAIASALMGITEKAIFSFTVSSGKPYSELPSAAVMANIIGVLFVVFGGLVVYLVTESSYKRKPMPEDIVLLTGTSNE